MTNFEKVASVLVVMLIAGHVIAYKATNDRLSKIELAAAPVLSGMSATDLSCLKIIAGRVQAIHAHDESAVARLEQLSDEFGCVMTARQSRQEKQEINTEND